MKIRQAIKMSKKEMYYNNRCIHSPYKDKQLSRLNRKVIQYYIRACDKQLLNNYAKQAEYYLCNLYLPMISKKLKMYLERKLVQSIRFI